MIKKIMAFLINTGLQPGAYRTTERQPFLTAFLHAISR